MLKNIRMQYTHSHKLYNSIAGYHSEKIAKKAASIAEIYK